jgi:hypothetical protein
MSGPDRLGMVLTLLVLGVVAGVSFSYCATAGISP